MREYHATRRVVISPHAFHPHRFDFAAVPIGAYEPRWFMAPYHVNPAEAIRDRDDIHSRIALGIHWGTFELTDEALDEPPRARERAQRECGEDVSRFFVLKHGETRRLAPARPG